jgi:2-keto-4-pentenoate hydratase/2-oxohepta-3-ene-1,7-dioic acid hydratase in catechol pathway
MKWATYLEPERQQQRAGFVFQQYIVDLEWLLKQQHQAPTPAFFSFHTSDATVAAKAIPHRLIDFLRDEAWHQPVREWYAVLADWGEKKWAKARREGGAFPFDQVQLTAPLPRPSSYRDFYAFEQHVQQARAKRGLTMAEEWYQIPAFYFSNHQAMIGPQEEVCFPSRSKKWDFELEIGIVIGKQGRDISRHEAFDHVFGLTILNDWSARDLQAEEVKVGLGPAKGKDFATSIGPFIMTREEWLDRLDGEQLDLAMEAYHNGKRVSSGNLKDLYWSIPQLIEHASRDCTLYPGDLIGTGTVGTGCILEQDEPQWLQSGDIVQLKVERLGVLENKVY